MVKSIRPIERILEISKNVNIEDMDGNKKINDNDRKNLPTNVEVTEKVSHQHHDNDDDDKNNNNNNNLNREVSGTNVEISTESFFSRRKK